MSNPETTRLQQSHEGTKIRRKHEERHLNFFFVIPSLLRVFVALLLVASPAWADFRFVHISDPHFGAGENHVTDAKLFKEISELNPRPAFVVATGDICEYGTPSEYELLKEALKSLAMPLHVAPGNHDVRWNPLGKEGFTRGTNAPLFKSWDHENIHFVTLDSTVLLEHWGHISQEQLDWLSKDLAKVGLDRPVIIGFHHWIGRDKVQVDNEQQLMKLVEPYNVVLWLQGHGHSDIQWNVNGTPAVMVKGLYQGSYIVADVNDREIKLTRRFLRDPKNNDELVRDKSVPPSQQVMWRELLTAPLVKPAKPQLRVLAREHSEGEPYTVVGVPVGGAVEYSMNGAEYLPAGLERGMRDGDTSVISLDPYINGTSETRYRVKLSDSRTYFGSIRQLRGDRRLLWESNIGGAVQSRIALQGDRLYVPSMGNEVKCLSTDKGLEVFQAKTDGPVFSAPHVADGAVYFGSADHHVYCIDSETGESRWRRRTGGAVLGGPNVAQGIVCVGSVDTKIYGLGAKSGNVVWTVQGGNMFQSKVATDGQHFFVGGWDNHFRCIDARSGRVEWDLELGRKQRFPQFSAFAPAIASPAVGDGKVFVSTNDGILHAIDVETAEEVWKIDGQKMGYSSPLYHDGRIYCALGDEGKVFCADAKTGEILWRGECGSVIYDSSFCFGGGRVFIATVSGIVSAFDARTGERAWQYRLAPGHVLCSPAADDGHVYIGSMNGNVTALPIK
jgi:outer membrane protein assembly factor BamB/3',5'-cyclic AMP phosphodiesterase CpdA